MIRRLVTFIVVAAITAFLSTYWLYEGDLAAALSRGGP